MKCSTIWIQLLKNVRIWNFAFVFIVARKLLESEEFNYFFFFNRNVNFGNSHVSGCKKQIRRQIYENFDRKAKTMAKYICITVFVISPVSYVVPIVMKSYYDYFVLNTSTDAFLLFYPTKWVLTVFCYGIHFEIWYWKIKGNFHFSDKWGISIFQNNNLRIFRILIVRKCSNIREYWRVSVDICK